VEAIKNLFPLPHTTADRSMDSAKLNPATSQLYQRPISATSRVLDYLILSSTSIQDVRRVASIAPARRLHCPDRVQTNFEARVLKFQSSGQAHIQCVHGSPIFLPLQSEITSKILRLHGRFFCI